MPAPQTTPTGSLFTVFLAAILTALIGATVAFASLATAKVREVTVMPTEAQKQPGEVYLLRGVESGAGAWSLNRQELLQGQSGIYYLSEGDLNVWARNDLPVEIRRSPDSEPERLVIGGFRPSTPNFRIDEGNLEILIVWEAPWKSAKGTKITQHVVGNFINADGDVSFIVTGGHIGKVPALAVPGLSKFLLKNLITQWQSFESVAEVTQAMANVTDARIDNDKLRLEVR